MTHQQSCSLCNSNALQLTQTASFYDAFRAQDTNWEICPECVEDELIVSCRDCGDNYPNPGIFQYAETHDFENESGDITSRYINIITPIRYYHQSINAYICHPCRSLNHFFCGHCHSITPNEQMQGNGLQLCASCRISQGRRIRQVELRRTVTRLINGEIHDYHYNPLKVLDFLGKPKDNLYYGVELELECEDRKLYALARKANNLMDGFAILKFDGSLNGGFEIVSAPATLDIHAQRWKTFFEQIPSSYKRGLSASSRTGMHVHVSRKGLTQLTIGKLLVFMNERQHNQEITDIAGRLESSYAQFKRKKITDVGEINDCRYEAINLRRSGTIEFRIFASTTSYNELMMRLEFVAAAIAFCEQASIKHLDWLDFLDWLLQNRSKQYHHLWLFLIGDSARMGEAWKK